MSDTTYAAANVLADTRSRRSSTARADDSFSGSIQFALALFALFFVLPLMIAIGVAVFCSDRGPIIFKHRRIGKDGRPFYCYKFRSMAMDAERRLQELLASDADARAEWARDFKLRNDPRVTPLGDFLRRSSLDELPQLFNVLRGEMNLVGPRPIVHGETPRYGRRLAAYQSVKPGITGLWQVSGRNDVSYRSRVAMDCFYATKRTCSMDLWILVATVPAVLSRKGCY